MKRLILVGGGLTHLEVLRRLTTRPFPETEVVLISDQPRSVYAGMLPGVVAGHYTPDAMSVDLVALAGRAGVRFHLGRVLGMGPDSRTLMLADGSQMSFSHASFNTGAWSRPIPIAPQGRSLAIKPAPDFVTALRAWETGGSLGGTAAVFGGGVSGIEMVFALAHRWRSRRAAPVLVERSGLALTRVPDAARDRVRAHLRRAGITVLADAGELDVTLAINAAGAAAPDWLAQTGLALDHAGYLAVRPTLQARAHDHIFASGDVASMDGQPRAKAGVFAVRQGPALYHNLRLVLAGKQPLAHQPQNDWLSLIATGPRHAVGTRNGLAVEGGWVWHLKDLNDRLYLKRYR